MAILGEEVADAYISIHADTDRFRADVKKLQASSKKLFDEVGDEGGKAFQKAFTKEINNVSLKSLTTKAKSELAKMGRTLATDMRIIGARIQDGLIKPINRALTRAFNGVIVGVGKAKDAVVDFGRAGADVIGGQVSNQILRLRVLTDRFVDAVRSMGPEFLNAAIGMREMIAPGAWDRFTKKAREAMTGLRQVADLGVAMFRDSFDRAWNNNVVAAAREWVADLGRAMKSGLSVVFQDLATTMTLGFQMTGDTIKKAANDDIGARFSDMWSKITRQSKKGAKDTTEAFEHMADGVDGATRDVSRSVERNLGKDTGNAVEKFVDGVGDSTAKLARTTTKNIGKADKKINTQFIGRLKGGRNDAVNAIGAIGGAIENLISNIVTGGFKLAGNLISNLGDNLVKLGGGTGGLANVGGVLQKLGGALAATSASGVGIIVVITVVIASFAALGFAAALLTTFLSALLGIITALAGALAYGIAGALLALGPMALAAAAGVAALVIAFKDMDEQTEKTFKPLQKGFKELKRAVQDEMFKNLAEQVKGLNSILKESVTPLLVAAAAAMRGAIDYLIAAFQRPEVAAALTSLSQTLPGIMTALGAAATDMLVGLLGFFTAIAPAVEGIAGQIATLAKQFADWAVSVAGQTAIKEFFDKAWVSAQLLWDIVVDLGLILGEFFAKGKEDGDGFLQKIKDILDEFLVWVQDEKNRQKITDWFDQAKAVAKSLYENVKLISEAIVKLDTPENRKALLSVLNAFMTLAGWVDTVSGGFKDIPTLIAAIKTTTMSIPGASAILGTVEGIVNALKYIGNFKMPNIKANVGNFFSGMTNPFTRGATGGLISSPTRMLIGEAGPEMLVPLARPLNQVDPAVRAVSAFARGADPSQFTGGGSNANPGGKVVNISDGAIVVNAPTDDPRQTANAVLDRLVARWK